MDDVLAEEVGHSICHLQNDLLLVLLCQHWTIVTILVRTTASQEFLQISLWKEPIQSHSHTHTQSVLGPHSVKVLIDNVVGFSVSAHAQDGGHIVILQLHLVGEVY